MSRSFPLLTFALSSLLLSTSACSRTDDMPAAGGVASKTQNWSGLRDFTAIDATGPDNVKVTISPQFSVRAQGDERAIADLDIRVKGDKLLIGRKSSTTWSGPKIANRATIHVTMPAITGADLTGAGDLDLDRAEGDSLTLSLTGAGDFRIAKVKLKSLTTDITGAGSIKIAGATDRAKLSITGAGDIDGEALKIGDADVSVLGAGDIDFASDGKVAINIMGPGDVTVKGKAQCTIKGLGPGEARCAP